MTAAAAAAAVRADLLDTYQARLRASLETLDGVSEEGFAVRSAGEAALARGYFALLAPAYAEQRGRTAADSVAAAFDRLVPAAAGGDRAGLADARADIDGALEGFRAAPLAPEEELRRAGQLQRFLALVPIEYDRGVEGGQVTLDFEVQEAITFRDGAAQAFGDLENVLAERDQAETRRLGTLLAQLGHRPRRRRPRRRGRRSGGGPGGDGRGGRPHRLALPGRVEGRRRDGRLRRHLGDARPPRGRHRGRPVLAGRAGAARGLRVLRVRAGAAAPRARARPLRQGRGALLVRRRRPSRAGAAREAEGGRRGGGRDAEGARRRARRRRERGRAPGRPRRSRSSSNTAIIVFREGLEAVLILAALMAGMVGAQARFRRPLLFGALRRSRGQRRDLGDRPDRPRAASAATGRSSRRSSRSSRSACSCSSSTGSTTASTGASTSRSCTGRRSGCSRSGSARRPRSSSGSRLLGFSSVYREGFETVLFLQALVLEAGAGDRSRRRGRRARRDARRGRARRSRSSASCRTRRC